MNALNSGATPSSVVLGIESSTEYLTIQVVALYQHYLDRAPEPAGQQFWVSFLQTGGTLEQVAEGLASSPEYFQDHGGTNQGFVFGLYNQVLGRGPTNVEMNSWVNRLDAGETRLPVAIQFLTSTEYRTQLVESDYADFLGRRADAAGLANWLAALQAGMTDQEVLAQIFGSPEGFTKWS